MIYHVLMKSFTVFDCIYFIFTVYTTFTTGIPSPKQAHYEKKTGGDLIPTPMVWLYPKVVPLWDACGYTMWLSSSSQKYKDTDVSEVLEGKCHVLNWTDAPSKTPNFKTLVACIHSTQ